jgi:hypothetical protein
LLYTPCTSQNFRLRHPIITVLILNHIVMLEVTNLLDQGKLVSKLLKEGKSFDQIEAALVELQFDQACNEYTNNQ